MTDNQSGPELVRDDELTQELRAIYAPPAHAAYWSALEKRILDALDEDGADAWWTVPDRWLRIGLVAAGIAVIVAGSLFLRTQTQVSRMAYDNLVAPSTIDILEVAERQRLTEQQQTYRFLTGR